MKWIWTKETDRQVDSYRCFRKTFKLNTSEKAHGVLLEISADSYYDVFVNGVRCPVTQFSDFPEDKTFAQADITPLVNVGLNCIAVRVQFIGRRFFTYTPGCPGLALRVRAADDSERAFAATDESWRWRVDACYASGMAVTVSSQLGFTSCYDAHGEDGWMMHDYDDSSWANAVEVTWFQRTLRPRPVPCLKELQTPTVKVIQTGWLKRSAEGETFAKTCSQDYLLSDRKAVEFAGGSETDGRHLFPDSSRSMTFKSMPDDVDGVYMIADLGQETVGYISISMEAAEGTIVDILHGEHLEDGRVRGSIHDRNFCDRYICRGGAFKYTHSLRRCGARYVELHITKASGPVEISYAGLTPVELPLLQQGRLSLDDQLFMRIHDVAISTLKLCMHEHYEDCPWREQALYAYDSRNQMLYGYYTWGNYDFAATSLDLLGRSYFGNGDIGIVAPSRPDEKMLMITSFTLVWISELFEHCMHSGSMALFEKFRGVVSEILEKALARQEDERPLYHAQKHPNAWNFFEWTPNLSRQNEFPQSPYNLYLYEALVSAAKLHELSGEPQEAERLLAKASALGSCLEQTFWDEAEGCYATLLPGKVKSSEHIQALMLYNRLVPETKVARVFNSLQSGRLHALSYSVLAYYVRGLMAGTSEMRAAVEPFLARQFEAPVLNGATSLWETPLGSDDFDFAGSCCHAWSSIHAFYSKRYLLGVSPLTPGFKRFQVKPYPGKHAYAEGDIPTPDGAITVSWKQTVSGLDVVARHPETLKPELAEYPEAPIAHCQFIKYSVR